MRCTFGHVFLTSLLMTLPARRAKSVPEDQAEFQNKAPLKLVWANEGEDVELPCDITPPTSNDSVNMVLWFKDTAGIPLYSLDARSGDLATAIHWAVGDDLGNRTYFQIGDGHRAKLKVTKVTFKDQGIYRCRVDFVDSPTRNFRVNLTLVEEPSDPVIYDAQGREVTGVGGPFLEGYNLALTCQVAGGRPKPMVTWWKDGKMLDGVVDTLSVGTPNRFTVNHLFVDKVTRSLWGTKLECRAQSSPMFSPIVREVPLDIYLKPAIVKIVLGAEEIRAGRPIAARCETWGSSPAARIVWRLGGRAIGEPSVSTTQRSNSTVSKLALVLDKDDDGKELTCRAENPRFPGGVLEQTKVLNVAYVPVVSVALATGYVLDTLREGDDLKLVCNAQSNPPPLRVIWYHKDDRLQHDVSTGTLIASNTLTIRVLSLAHGGEYSCEAINAVGESRSRPIFIRMKYAPRCRVGHERREVTAGRHETVSLRCEVDAVPEDAIRFSWTYNGTLGDVLPMPNSRVRNNGLVSVLEYTPTSDADFGTLACWTSNSVGRQRTPCVFDVVPGSAGAAATGGLFPAERERRLGGELRPGRGRRFAAVLLAGGPGDPEAPGDGPDERAHVAFPPERSGNGRRGAGDLPGEESPAQLPAPRPGAGLRLHSVRVRGERQREERAGAPGARARRREDREERPVPGGSEEGVAERRVGERDRRDRSNRCRGFDPDRCRGDHRPGSLQEKDRDPGQRRPGRFHHPDLRVRSKDRAQDQIHGRQQALSKGQPVRRGESKRAGPVAESGRRPPRVASVHGLP